MLVPHCGGFVRVTAALIALALPGCSILPTSGPLSEDIRAQKPIEPDGLEYALVRLTPETARVLSHLEPKGIAGMFTDRRPPARQTFGVGDTVSVTIFEAAAGGLFIPTDAGSRPGNFITVPDQTVDNAGNISVPYAGAIRAQGRTAGEIKADIEQVLRNRAIEPQVVVALRNQSAGQVSVLGEVNAPNRFATAASGDRILDAITRAGGPKGQGYETWVMLERQGRRATVPFANLVYYPANNIYVQPGDTIYVYREPQTFLAFGASGQQGQFPFEAWRISLAEAVAKAGGLLDERADPASVFMYRPETRAVAEQLGVDVSRFKGQIVPVIYSINLREPGTYFIATHVQMRDKDVIFVSNAQAVEVTKFLQYLRIIMATAGDAANVANDAIILRNNIKTSF